MELLYNAVENLRSFITESAKRLKRYSTIIATVAVLSIFTYTFFGVIKQAFAALGDNMGFENGFSEWSQVAGSWNANNNSTYVRTGNKSAKIQVNSTAEYVLKSTTATYTVASSGTNYLAVAAWGKANINSECLMKVGVVNTSTGVYTWAPSFTTLTSTSFTQVSSSLSVTNGETYSPAIKVSRTASGSTDMIYVDDVHFYTNTSSSIDVTAPTAPRSIDITTSGTSITLNWVNGTDNGSGLAGVVVLRTTGIQTDDVTLNDQGTYHTTNTDIGPITVGAYNIIYCGAVTTMLTDNPGATGTYSYLIFMKDNALNYTTSATAARAWVFNGSSLNSTTINNSGIDGLYVAATCTLQTNSTSNVQVRSQAICNNWGTVINQGNLLNDLGASFTNKNGSLYKFDRNGASGYPVLSATWNTGSTCSITGITNGTTPAGLDQNFYHFTWNSPNQTAQQNLPTGFTVNGNATFTHSGTTSPGKIVNFNGTSYLRGNLSCTSNSELSFASGSTVNFDGSAQQTIQTTGPEIIFYNFTLDNSAGTLLLSNIKIASVCNLNNGLLNTGSYEANVTNTDESAVIHNANHYVVGTLRRSVTGDNDYDYPVGTTSSRQLAIVSVHNLTGVSNISARFSTTITGSAPDPQTCTINSVGLNALLNHGFWTIAPDQQPSSGTYDVLVKPKGYTNGQPSCFYYAVLKRDNSSSAWATVGQDDGPSKWQSGNIAIVKRKGLTSFSDFGVGTPTGTILPVTLSNLTASKSESGNVLVNWETSSELNSAYFSLERSGNGFDFESINTQRGAGTSIEKNYYSFVDHQPFSGTNYYRLKQVDYDSSYSYSNICQVTFESENNSISNVNVYPNSSTGIFYLDFKQPAHERVRACVEVFDSKGVLVVKKDFDAVQPCSIDLTGKRHGIYHLTVTSGDKRSSVTKQLLLQP